MKGFLAINNHDFRANPTIIFSSGSPFGVPSPYELVDQWMDMGPMWIAYKTGYWWGKSGFDPYIDQTWNGYDVFCGVSSPGFEEQRWFSHLRFAAYILNVYNVNPRLINLGWLSRVIPQTGSGCPTGKTMNQNTTSQHVAANSTYKHLAGYVPQNKDLIHLRVRTFQYFHSGTRPGRHVPRGSPRGQRAAGAGSQCARRCEAGAAGLGADPGDHGCRTLGTGQGRGWAGGIDSTRFNNNG